MTDDEVAAVVAEKRDWVPGDRVVDAIDDAASRQRGKGTVACWWDERVVVKWDDLGPSGGSTRYSERDPADLSLPAPPDPPSVDDEIGRHTSKMAWEIANVFEAIRPPLPHARKVADVVIARARAAGAEYDATLAARARTPEPSDAGPDLPEVGRRVDLLDKNGVMQCGWVKVTETHVDGGNEIRFDDENGETDAVWLDHGWSWRYSDDGPPEGDGWRWCADMDGLAEGDRVEVRRHLNPNPVLAEVLDLTGPWLTVRMNDTGEPRTLQPSDRWRPLPDPHEGKEAVWLPPEDVDWWVINLDFPRRLSLITAARATVAAREGES